MARGKEEKEEYKVPKGDSPEDLSAAINKYFKSNVCNVASHAEETQAGIVHLYPTGILSLDKYLGVGGLLGGRIVNIWGWEGCLTGDSKILNVLTGINERLIDFINETALVPCVPSYTIDGNMASSIPGVVSARYITGNKPCMSIKTKHNTQLSGSTNHPVVVKNSGWTRLDNIKVGDLIARPKRIRVDGHNRFTPNFCKLIGYLLGDGCLTGESVRMSIHDPIVLADVTKLVSEEYPSLMVKKVGNSKGMYAITSGIAKHDSNPLLTQLQSLGIMGLKHLDKTIPSQLITANDECIKHLLSGLLMSDGHVAAQKPRIQFHSISLKLVEQVKFLLHRIGVVSTISERNENRSPLYHNCFSLSANGVRNLIPLQSIPLVGKRLERLGIHLNKQPHEAPYDSISDVWWDEVTSVDDIGIHPVYDITVNDTHSFVANDIVVHNTGKTLTALTVAANIQKLRFEPTVLNPKGKGRVAFLDAEGSYSPSMAKSIGVNPDEIILIRSTPERILSGEDYFAMIGILIQNGIEMIIIDSVPALVPSNRLTARIGEGMKATSAQMMAEGLGQVNTFLNSFRRPIVWFINQVRMKPMSMFGPSEDHTGGAALKFFSTYSIEVKKWDKEDIVRMVPNKAGSGWENRTIGVKINATLHKNKTNTIPQENINYLMFFESVTDKEGISYQAGVDVYNDVFQTALLAGVIQKNSSWYNYGDVKGNGEAQFIAALRAADPSILEAIRKEVLTGK